MAALIPLVLLFGLMWLLLIRPQQQRVRAAQSLQQSLSLGDEVVTAGGIFGTIEAMDDAELRLLVADGVTIRVLRAAVSRRTGPDVEPVDDEDEDQADEETDEETDEVAE
jgi:preprotein translocase subunit YajC